MKAFLSLVVMFLLTMTAVWFPGPPAQAAQPEINVGGYSKHAIHGHDPVAYFKAGKPVEGQADFELTYKGAKWLFASAENRDLFKADPQSYAPQYGGHCAYAASRGYIADADPVAWRIYNGKLYLNYNLQVKRLWENDVDGNIVKGDANWPGILTQ